MFGHIYNPTENENMLCVFCNELYLTLKIDLRLNINVYKHYIFCICYTLVYVYVKFGC